VNNYIVKDMMVPLSEYATVPKGATLYEAVLALEKAQEEFDHTKYHHRAVLILDSDNHVIGKLSQLDVLRAIKPENKQADKIDDIKRFGFSEGFINTIREQYRLEGSLLEHIGKIAMNVKVEDFMQAPSEGEYVEENTSLETAIHQLEIGLHLSLLVTRKDKIVGVLRMSDVFAAVFHLMKECEKKTE
jgi:CBS domain containing-hemolysin-like protein